MQKHFSRHDAFNATVSSYLRFCNRLSTSRSWLLYNEAAKQAVLLAEEASSPGIEKMVSLMKEFVALLNPFVEALAVFSSASPSLSVVYGQIQNLFYHVDTAFQVSSTEIKAVKIGF